MLKRYSFDGERPFEDEAFGEWVRFEAHAAALTALACEFEQVRAERVQADAVCGALRDRVHELNNQLTAVTLERDALKRKAAPPRCPGYERWPG